MTPERTFWELIKDHLPGDVSRIENGADEGTPDVSGAYGRDYWVELKVCFNKRDLAQVPSLLLASQVVWHLRRARHGSIIYVAVRYPNMKRIIFYEYRKGDGIYYPIINLISKGGFNWHDFEHKFKTILREA